jgi:hypothetical protein
VNRRAAVVRSICLTRSGQDFAAFARRPAGANLRTGAQFVSPRHRLLHKIIIAPAKV